MGTRTVPFTRELWIEHDDFRENPPPKYFRLAPGVEVRLRYGYVVKCVGVDHDKSSGEVVAVRCTFDPATRFGTPDGRKIKGTIHWVSADTALPAEVRLYEPLFLTPKPDEADDWRTQVNPASLEQLTRCYVEPSVAVAEPGAHFQFERIGYFCLDPDSVPGRPVFNRTVALRDTWAKIEAGSPAAKSSSKG